MIISLIIKTLWIRSKIRRPLLSGLSAQRPHVWMTGSQTALLFSGHSFKTLILLVPFIIDRQLSGFVGAVLSVQEAGDVRLQDIDKTRGRDIMGELTTIKAKMKCLSKRMLGTFNQHLHMILSNI